MVVVSVVVVVVDGVAEVGGGTVVPRTNAAATALAVSPVSSFFAATRGVPTARRTTRMITPAVTQRAQRPLGEQMISDHVLGLSTSFCGFWGFSENVSLLLKSKGLTLLLESIGISTSGSKEKAPVT